MEIMKSFTEMPELRLEKMSVKEEKRPETRKQSGAESQNLKSGGA